MNSCKDKFSPLSVRCFCADVCKNASLRRNAVKERPSVPHQCGMILQHCHYCEGIYQGRHRTIFPTERFFVSVRIYLSSSYCPLFLFILPPFTRLNFWSKVSTWLSYYLDMKLGWQAAVQLFNTWRLPESAQFQFNALEICRFSQMNDFGRSSLVCLLTALRHMV